MTCWWPPSVDERPLNANRRRVSCASRVGTWLDRLTPSPASISRGAPPSATSSPREHAEASAQHCDQLQGPLPPAVSPRGPCQLHRIVLRRVQGQRLTG